jgi:hypothetical protein
MLTTEMLARVSQAHRERSLRERHRATAGTGPGPRHPARAEVAAIEDEVPVASRPPGRTPRGRRIISTI